MSAQCQRKMHMPHGFIILASMRGNLFGSHPRAPMLDPKQEYMCLIPGKNAKRSPTKFLGGFGGGGGGQRVSLSLKWAIFGHNEPCECALSRPWWTNHLRTFRFWTPQSMDETAPTMRMLNKLHVSFGGIGACWPLQLQKRMDHLFSLCLSTLI